MAKRKKSKKQIGRIKLPKGKTGNERAKDAAQPAILKQIAEARAGLIPQSDWDTKEKKARFSDYLNGGDQACPHCSGPIVGGTMRMEGGEMMQEISCTRCQEEWQDIYKLSAVITMDGETIASKAIPEEGKEVRPYVLITVSGGVADIGTNEGADVDILDFDNLKDDPDMKLSDRERAYIEENK